MGIKAIVKIRFRTITGTLEQSFFLLIGIRLCKAENPGRASKPAWKYQWCRKDCRQDYGNSSSPLLSWPGDLFHFIEKVIKSDLSHRVKASSLWLTWHNPFWHPDFAVIRLCLSGKVKSVLAAVCDADIRYALTHPANMVESLTALFCQFYGVTTVWDAVTE